jgi:hypothetical protein
MAASTAVSTATALAWPSDATSGMSATHSDRSAMITVLPANTMAPPEVATARAIESCRSVPWAVWSRCLVTRNSA